MYDLSDLLGCGLWKNIVQRNKGVKKIKFIVPSPTTQCIRWITHNLCYSYLKSNMGEVYVFWEGQKKLQNLHRQFDVYLVSVKSTVKILSFFVAFLEHMNFNYLLSSLFLNFVSSKALKRILKEYCCFFRQESIWFGSVIHLGLALVHVQC